MLDSHIEKVVFSRSIPRGFVSIDNMTEFGNGTIALALAEL